MAASTGPVLAAGAITAANELLFAPAHAAAKGKGGQPLRDFNWRLIPATAAAALALAGLERVSPTFAVGLAWLALATALVLPLGNAPSPLANAAAALGGGGQVLGGGKR